jgi:hypothetical protein
MNAQQEGKEKLRQLQVNAVRKTVEQCQIIAELSRLFINLFTLFLQLLLWSKEQVFIAITLVQPQYRACSGIELGSAR